MKQRFSRVQIQGLQKSFNVLQCNNAEDNIVQEFLCMTGVLTVRKIALHEQPTKTIIQQSLGEKMPKNVFNEVFQQKT